LAVKVLSPGDTSEEIEEKVAEWLAAGARMVWVVSPKRRTVPVYRSLKEIKILTEQDELDGGNVVPGFHCRVADIFV
jgi:Uma2 family endonuclease